MKADERIFDASDLCKRDGKKNHKDWITSLSNSRKRANLLDTPFTGSISGDPIPAFIDFGRWIARCPSCNGAEYVSKDEAIFYCFSCGNYENNGDAYPVQFPADVEEIEQELLKRPQKFASGGNLLGRQFNARPLVPGLSRTWHSEESLADLKAQNEKIKEDK